MSSTTEDQPMTSSLPEHHASAFGQLVTGPPGAGKSTYCHGMYQVSIEAFDGANRQFLTALGRPVKVINLDPAVTDPPYPCAVSITELITLQEVMDEYGLGPNGAMLYCMEYLEENFDWLLNRLDEVLAGEGGNGYIIIDTPGQAELWTNHDSLKHIIQKLQKLDYRLAAVHLTDAHAITDPSKYIAAVLLALRAMLQLEMPHINVLSKIDTIGGFGELPFNLEYYTQVQDLGYLLQTLQDQPRAGGKKMKKLNEAMVELIEDFSLVGFETLAVEDKQSMMHLVRVIDKATGYIFVPLDGSTTDDNMHALFSTAARPMDYDVNDVQERYSAENKEAYDKFQEEQWEKEWAARHQAEAIKKAMLGQQAPQEGDAAEHDNADAQENPRSGRVQIRPRDFSDEID
ncbi:cytoplasm protein [Trichosporon asahii var. asahii CBS 8904]|uniref:GPN-loop GTPase 2 n=2 Tax=Trichosporon asahii var. asahii TaxID=189963 RepID=K1VMV9_TRIAC|nr:cytoplasm protein [Trichosporon asahii var. asahii CBS 2479]EJT52750.1 cytoplasm protein [Trichosporon asahii var. asahii CBS 2479]EKD00717.1 cytoplasm protein [Trichosporon asahii var. asahii CBS 8904]